jgi:hypothetical protein
LKKEKKYALIVSLSVAVICSSFQPALCCKYCGLQPVQYSIECLDNILVLITFGIVEVRKIRNTAGKDLITPLPQLIPASFRYTALLIQTPVPKIILQLA